jgi:Family of unknown function (DUF6788)
MQTPPILHGPYYSWTRKINGKTVTRTLTPDQARRYQPWFDDARQLRTLAAELEALSLTLTEHAEAWGRNDPREARNESTKSAPGSFAPEGRLDDRRPVSAPASTTAAPARLTLLEINAQSTSDADHRATPLVHTDLQNEDHRAQNRPGRGDLMVGEPGFFGHGQPPQNRPLVEDLAAAALHRWVRQRAPPEPTPVA